MKILKHQENMDTNMKWTKTIKVSDYNLKRLQHENCTLLRDRNKMFMGFIYV